MISSNSKDVTLKGLIFYHVDNANDEIKEAFASSKKKIPPPEYPPPYEQILRNYTKADKISINGAIVNRLIVVFRK